MKNFINDLVHAVIFVLVAFTPFFVYVYMM
jgi:hypothetical protein